MEYDEQIKRLRGAAGGPEGIQMCIDAADALEDLQAESIMHHSAADNYYAELNEYREERNAAMDELTQMSACVYYKPGGLCRHGGDDPANICVLGPCPYVSSAEDVLADLARVTAERDAAMHDLELFAMCDTCKFGETEMAYDCLGCDHASKWKWRGIKEEDAYD